MATLTDAITRAETTANSLERLKEIKAVTIEENSRIYECRQLADWLRELEYRRKALHRVQVKVNDLPDHEDFEGDCWVRTVDVLKVIEQELQGSGNT